MTESPRHQPSNRSSRPRSIARSAIGLCVLLALGGCQTERISGGGTMPPAPRPAPVTPDSAAPTRMLLGVGSKPIDTDGNGFPDMIMVSAHLFAEPHPTPIFDEGTFTFELYRAGTFNQPQATPLAKWTITGERLEQAKTRSLAGPMYNFRLNLNEAGGDRYPLQGVDLAATFVPDTAPQKIVRPGGLISMQIGREGAVVQGR